MLFRSEIELQALALHHLHVGEVIDPDRGKIGLSRDGAQARKLRAFEMYPVIAFGMFKMMGNRICLGVFRMWMKNLIPPNSSNNIIKLARSIAAKIP